MYLSALENEPCINHIFCSFCTKSSVSLLLYLSKTSVRKAKWVRVASAAGVLGHILRCC